METEAVLETPFITYISAAKNLSVIPGKCLQSRNQMDQLQLLTG